jgi:predicted NBD/HSP70 family sugar kinase
VIRQHFDQQGVRRDDFCRDGLAKVIAEADKELDHISVEMRPLFDRHPQVVKFCDEVLDAYVAVLAGGIGTLTNIVDTGRLFMSGPLIETLARNRCFRSYLQRHLPHHLLDRKAQPDLQRTDATQGLWRGAALLAWDPAFHRRRMRV